MKKLFTIAAAILASACMFAATETSANAGTSNADHVGTSFTIPGKYVAGAGGTKVSPMPNKGIKVRTNTDQTITINVNEGYKFTALKLTGVTNTNDKAATFGSIEVDGVAWNGVFDTTLPAKNAAAAAEINVTGINATQSVVFNLSDLNTTSQANICLEVTYEVTATTYTVIYKANNGTEDADVVDAAALKVKGCTFSKEDAYFIGWNTAADGNGDAYAEGDAVTSDLTLYAQWKAFVACAKLLVASTGDTPAKDGVVALKEESNGGKMYFHNAKEGKFDESFVYTDNGLQLCKGNADTLRVELDNYLKVGSTIRVDLYATNAGTAIDLVSSTKTITLQDVNVAKSATTSLYYEVTDEDGLAGTYVFYLKRNNTTVLNSLQIAECGDAVPETPTAIANTAVDAKAVKVVRDGQLIIIRDGVEYNALGAEVR